MRNNVTFSICKFENEYIKLFLDKYRNNTSLIWKGIWQLVTLKSKSKVHPNMVKVKDKDTTNPTEIANAFNNFVLYALVLICQKPFLIQINHLENFSKIAHWIHFCSNHLAKMKCINLHLNNERKSFTSIKAFQLQFLENVNVLSTLLSFIINRSFEQGIFPESLTAAQFMSVLKKEDILTVSNYRPISLLSVYCKIFEKSIYKRINSCLCKRKLINTNQFGFRSKHSTEHASISLIETIKGAL